MGVTAAEITARFRKLKPGAEFSLERRYRQPADRLFAALSTPERISDWMGVDWLGDAAPLRLGSRFAYRFPDSDMTSEGHVTAFEPGRVIAHTWFENLPPPATVRWAVAPDGENSVLTLTQSYPAADDATRNASGWTLILRQLAGWLGDGPAPAEPFDALRDHYAQAFGPAAVRDGRRTTIDGRPVVRFVRLVEQPVEAVWAMLTDPGKLPEWLGPVDIEPRVGGAFRIHFTMAPIVMEGTITAIDPPHRLAMIWREPWFTADDVVLAFDLAPHPDGTLLTLTHTFPAGYDPHDYLAGWHDFMDTLEEALEGRPVVWNTPARKTRYATLERTYASVRRALG